MTSLNVLLGGGQHREEVEVLHHVQQRDEQKNQGVIKHKLNGRDLLLPRGQYGSDPGAAQRIISAPARNAGNGVCGNPVSAPVK